MRGVCPKVQVRAKRRSGIPFPIDCRLLASLGPPAAVASMRLAWMHLEAGEGILAERGHLCIHRMPTPILHRPALIGVQSTPRL